MLFKSEYKVEYIESDKTSVKSFPVEAAKIPKTSIMAWLMKLTTSFFTRINSDCFPVLSENANLAIIVWHD